MKKNPDMSLWTGRIDDEGPSALRWHQQVRPWQADSEPGVALLGFACDAGVRRNHGRVGAASGPLAIRQTLSGQPWHLASPVYDAGDVLCVDDQLELAQAELSREVAQLLAGGHFPVVLGGGHEVAYGSYQGLAMTFSEQAEAPRIGIINLDAHLDMRLSPQASSGTPFAQISRHCKEKGWPFLYFCAGVSETANTAALLDNARALGVEMVFDEQMHPWHLHSAQERLQAFIDQCDCLYLSIDMDVLPAAQAPGVSAPAAYGVQLATLEQLIDQIRSSKKLRLADLAEFNPLYDQDKITARVAARLIHRLTR